MPERTWNFFGDAEEFCKWMRDAYRDDTRLLPTGDLNSDVQLLTSAPTMSTLYEHLMVPWLQKGQGHCVGVGMSFKHRTKIAKICLCQQVNNKMLFHEEIWNRSQNRSNLKRFNKSLWPIRKALRTAGIWGLAAATYPDSDANRISPSFYRGERRLRHSLNHKAVQIPDNVGPEDDDL